jgi:tetratricopeptide (TPR) repeat protein
VFFAWLASALGYAQTHQGQVAEALPLMEQAVEHVVALRIQYNQAMWVGWLSEAYLLDSRSEEAEAHAEHALALSRTYKERGNEAWILRLLAEIAMHRDPPDIGQVETHYQQALALANELGMRPLQAHCHRGLGLFYSQTGQSEQARAKLAMAIEMYRAMKMKFWLPETEAGLAAMVTR